MKNKVYLKSTGQEVYETPEVCTDKRVPPSYVQILVPRTTPPKRGFHKVRRKYGLRDFDRHKQAVTLVVRRSALEYKATAYTGNN